MGVDRLLRSIAKRAYAWADALLRALAASGVLFPVEGVPRLAPVRIASRRRSRRVSHARRPR